MLTEGSTGKPASPTEACCVCMLVWGQQPVLQTVHLRCSPREVPGSQRRPLKPAVSVCWCEVNNLYYKLSTCDAHRGKYREASVAHLSLLCLYVGVRLTAWVLSLYYKLSTWEAHRGSAVEQASFTEACCVCSAVRSATWVLSLYYKLSTCEAHRGKCRGASVIHWSLLRLYVGVRSTTWVWSACQGKSVSLSQLCL